MPDSPNGGRFYEIHGSATIAEAFRQVQRQAVQENRGQEMVGALRLLRQGLQRNPLKLGEPLYRLAALQMEIRMAAIGPLAVSFGVCEDRPLVFIKAVSLLSN